MAWQSGGAAGIPGLTSDGANGIVVVGKADITGDVTMRGSAQVATALNAGDLTNAPDPTLPLQLGPGGNALFVGTAGDGYFLGAVSSAGVTSGGDNSLVARDSSHLGAAIVGKGSGITDSDTWQARNNVGVIARVDGAGNIRTQTGLGVFSHAAPTSQPVLATGAGHTADDVITLLQSYGICKQA